MAYGFKKNQDFIEYLLQQAQNDQDSFLNKANNINNNVYSTGQKMSTAGDFLQNNFNSPVAQNIGSKLSGYGNQTIGVADKVSNVLNAPKNVFQGYAPKPFAFLNGATPAATGASTAGGTAVTQAIQNAAPMASIGSTAAGVGSGTAAGTAAGTGTGAAAGGAAAGGSAASGAAAAGPIGAIVALATMAAMGTNRKRAKKSGEALLNSTNQMVNEESDAALNQTQQFAQNAQNQTQDYSQPVITGGAAPAEPQLTPIQEYQNALREQGYSDDVINGIPQGLNSGDKNIAQWIEQYNNGSGRDNPIRIPQTAEEIAAAKAGSFNMPTQTAGASENIKKGLLDKFINGIGDLATGYQENRNNSFKPENLQRDNSKSNMNRVGEVLGTISRIAQNPAVQGLVAGGVSTAITGNPLYGVGKGYEFANNRAMSNARREALKQYGINLPEIGTFGNYSDKDVNALTTPYYKEAMNNIALARLKEVENYHNQMIENQKQLNNIRQQTADIKQQNANTQEYKAKNGSKVTHVSNNSKPQNKSTSGSEATVQMQAPNGKIYLVPESQISRYKKAGGKIVG